jgi:hypothetical protein
MLLRASGEREQGDYNVLSVTDDKIDPGVPNGTVIRQITERTISCDWLGLAEYREQANDLIGAQQVVDVCVVAAAFNGITRVADCTGIPLDDNTSASTEQLREQTGIQAFDYHEKASRYAR